MQASGKAFERLSGKDKNDAPVRAPYIFVKDGYNWVRINIGELQYVESEGNYLTFQELGRITLTRMTIGKAQVPLASGYRDELLERVK